MEPAQPSRVSRRAFLHGAVAIGAAAVLGACRESGGPSERGAATDGQAPGPAAPPTSGAGGTQAPGQPLQPTPSCPDGDEPTPAQTEGPYFTPSSPERASLLDGVSSGTKLLLTGSVVDTSCRPIARALLDFWQADAAGNYDNDGYRLRGHLFAGADGRFRLETIVPGRYAGRTPHVHVKVQPPGGDVLTTQLYFPGEPGNAGDRIFRPELLLDVHDRPGGREGTFTFVLRS